MKNIKKTGMGLLVAALAFGFSAFKTVKRGDIVTYYKTDMTHPSPSDKRGYAYYSDDRCEPGGNMCSAQWEIGLNTAPTADGTALPTIGVTFQSSTVTEGHFE